ncbi:hypothetical protein DV515_00018502, partial [Chloebia gouldiae]
MDFQWFLVTMLLPGGWALQQSPDTIVRVGDTVTLECSASGKTFVNMYWYKLPVEKDVSMQLVVYSLEGGKADIEKEFKNRFQMLALEQSPHMVIKEGQSVNLECSKKKTSNSAMYWFVLPSQKNSSLTQLVYAFEGAKPEVEKGFESRFKSSKIIGDSITLSIEHAFLNDSGTYYCAESDHS